MIIIITVVHNLYTEIALRSVSMFFRSNPEWQIIKPLIDIGKNAPLSLHTCSNSLSISLSIKDFFSLLFVGFVGWRINKHYFLIGSKVNPSLSKRVLTWV